MTFNLSWAAFFWVIWEQWKQVVNRTLKSYHYFLWYGELIGNHLLSTQSSSLGARLLFIRSHMSVEHLLSF